MNIKPEKLSDAVTLYEGDCLDVLPTLSGVDAIITDPPYGVQFQSARRIEIERFDVIEGDEQPRTEWISAGSKALNDGGPVLCFCEWKGAEEFRIALSRDGLKVGAQLVWDRVIHGLGDLKGRPAPQHDLIWFAIKGRYLLPGRRPSSVYRYQRVSPEELDHPTQKPIGLMARLITDYTKSGNLILDPFAGSGTTGVAAAIEGRRAILIEKDPHYCEIIRRRIADAEATGPQSLFKNVKHPELFAGSAA